MAMNSRNRAKQTIKGGLAEFCHRPKLSKVLPKLLLSSLCAIATMSSLSTSGMAVTSERTTLEAKLVDNMSTEIGCPIYSWATTADPTAVIVAIHGATLHGRSYAVLGDKLAQKGYAVFAPDMRGFGSWYHDEHPGEEFPKHVLYRRSERDIKALLVKLRQLYPRKPIYLMGESVGANMAIRLLALDGSCADGMILSSPAIRQRMFVGPSVIKQIITVFFLNPKAQLDITPFLKSRVSESQEIIDERVNDELARNRMNAGELFKTRFFNKDSIKLVPALPDNLPVLIIEGSLDKLFDAADIKKLLSELPMEDKKLQLLEGKGHIHLETKYLKPDVEEIVCDWLSEKSAKYAKHQGVIESKVSALQSTEK